MNPKPGNINNWKDEIEQLREMSKSHADCKGLIAFYGSSSIRLWENMAKDLAPHNTINLGFGGSSYQWCDYFFGDVFEFIKPSRIVLYAGDNDLGTGTPENDIIHSVNNLLTKLAIFYEGIPISIISVKPSPDRLYLKKEIESLNQKLLKKTQQIDNGHFIDVYSSMLDSEGNVRPELYLEDELHMNLKGYEIWKSLILQNLDSTAS